MKCEWKTVKLGDIAEFNKYTYSVKDEWKFVHYLDTGNITENKIEAIQYIDLIKESLPSRAKRKVKNCNIIYSTVRPNQLHYGYIKEQPNNFLVSTGFAVIDVNEEFANSQFIYYFLTQNSITDYLHSIAEQSVSAYPSIKSSDLAGVEINLPDLETQKKIAKILSSLDDKIELNNAINQNLQQQAQAIFKSWFIDFESFGGKMPDDWEQGKLSDYVTVKRGGSPRPIQEFLSDEGYYWLKISDVTALKTPFVINIAEHIKKSGLNKTVYLKSGSLVLSNSATPGIPKILDVDTCIHDGWLYFQKSQLSKEFLYLLFLYIRPSLIALGNGSVFTNLKTDILKEYQLNKPTKEVLKAFDELIHPLFNVILNNTRQINKLTNLRDALLPKLMSGELDVSEVEI